MSNYNNNKLDIIFVEPDSSISAYQKLADVYSAIETPTWALLLAQACRINGFTTSILDIGAEKLDISRAVERIREENPRLICITVYGQNPNSGTTNMVGALDLAKSFPYSLRKGHENLYALNLQGSI